MFGQQSIERFTFLTRSLSPGQRVQQQTPAAAGSSEAAKSTTKADPNPGCGDAQVDQYFRTAQPQSRGTLGSCRNPKAHCRCLGTRMGRCQSCP
ncbi:hypothetical protein HaLaN_06578 [Haematococcus lacustris]|uniref:Uncharacterized protein n=1 Tax=Haematococcus lacustris TaxID=44745 RepID=A0A699YLZ2_HAELA|nr:hypothetical protein HaLaN_06578 [Haematococcus lacustris]